MNFTSCIAGLPEDISLWNSLTLMRYLFLLGILDCASGRGVFQTICRSKYLYLPRIGYRGWFRMALKRSNISVLLLMGIVFLFDFWTGTDSVQYVLIAAGVLGLNIITLTGIQTLLILNWGPGFGFVSLIFIQVFSLFMSHSIPEIGKLLLPGNWGMVMRSTLSTEAGYPLFVAVGIELLLLLGIWTEGWRLVRWYDRKDRKI